MRLVLCFLLVLLSTYNAFGDETDFDNYYQNTVLPFYWNAPQGTLYGAGGAPLVYKVFENPAEKGAIVFVTGWTETHLKYAELIYEFYQHGYSIYSMDNRGMGMSARLTNNPKKVHVDKFQDYVSDLKQFVDTVVRKKLHSKTYFVCHSMGGLVVAQYLTQYPWDADAAVFSSPLFELNTGKIPETVAYSIAKSALALGADKKYALTQKDTSYSKASNFYTQKSTHSQKRWKYKIANWKRFPYLLQGGSSYQWIKETLESTFKLLNGGWKDMPVPSLIFQSSEDIYVITRSHQLVCAQAKDCRLERLNESYHELFLELDIIRNKVIADTLNFLELH